jgi:hypothetical protein
MGDKVYLTREMFEHGTCVLGDSWVSDRIWLIKKEHVANVASFKDEELACEFLGSDIRVYTKPENEADRVVKSGSQKTFERAPICVFDHALGEVVQSVFLADDSMVLLDPEIVKWFGIDKVTGKGPSDPVSYAPLGLWVMPQRIWSSECGEAFKRNTSLKFNE